MSALLRSPLLHFVIVGCLLHVAQGLRTPPVAEDGPDREIEIETSVLERLEQQFADAVGRRPNATERARMIAAEVEEEILFREAVARGLLERDGGVQTRLIQKMLFLEGEATLDEAPALLARAIELDLHREDIVVRRILVQKMRLLGGRLRETQAVTEREIEARYADVQEALRAPDRASLSHVFLSRDAPGSPRERANALRETLLLAKADPTTAPRRGDPFPLGHDLTGRSRDDLDRTFGEGFGAAVFAAAAAGETWSEPIASAYGFHLVRVERIDTGQVPALDLVADRLRLEIEEERRAANLEALLSDLRSRYRIRTPRSSERDRAGQETG